ncbi:hypothetical protein [Bradyrhizobium canariense]|uniref:hypothetical protein n=1 Tax=Bradyrhizobium canariense TaxID=255045 RepID=UPI0014314043|nr:hypothetical protein [Bradyrhizobium canariense]
MIAASVSSRRVDEPALAPLPEADPAAPVVTPAPEFKLALEVAGEPDAFAVPALLVPDAGCDTTFDGLPAPLGSLPELLRPPTFAGPDGTPLTPAVPAPAEPAFGEPAAVPLPAEAPLAAPPALCANAATGDVRRTIAVRAAATVVLFIGKSPYAS